MRKILAFVLFIVGLFYGKNTFALEPYSFFIYKDNIVGIISDNEGIFNGKNFTGTIIIGEDGNILKSHDIVFEDNSNILKIDSHIFKSKETIFKSNNSNIVGEKQNQKFIGDYRFLQNGDFIVDYTNINGEKILNLNGKDIFKGNINEDVVDDIHFIDTKIVDEKNNEIGVKSYFIKEGSFLEIVNYSSLGRPFVFVDIDKKDLSYDITCNSGGLNFLYNGVPVIKTDSYKRLYFPIGTILNINGKQYYLKKFGEVRAGGCKIEIRSTGLEPIEVKNSEIIKIENINKIKKRELVSFFYKITDDIYFLGDKIYYKGNIYDKNDIFLGNSTEGIMIAIYTDDFSEIYLNNKIIYKGNEEGVENFINKNYPNLNLKPLNYNKDYLTTIDDFKNFYLNLKESKISEKSTNILLDINTPQTQNIEPKIKAQYVKQKLLSSSELKKQKQEKYIKQIDLVVEKADKKKLEEIFNKIQKIKSDNQIIKYIEASIYLQLNKTN